LLALSNKWLKFLQGANKQGIRAHVRVKKKFDNLGVGRVEAGQHAQDWTLDMANFSDTLSRLKEVVSKHSYRNDASSSESEDTDIPANPPTKALCHGKRKRHQTSDGGMEASNSSPVNLHSSMDDGCTQHGSSVGSVKQSRLTSHSGRYSKHSNSKRVKGYAAADLAAILGKTLGVPYMALGLRFHGSRGGMETTVLGPVM
jgi:Pin2-interacting protein X1